MIIITAICASLLRILPYCLWRSRFLSYFSSPVCSIHPGIATGTIVYVVFFEIFPKAREIGGSGFRSVLAMALGFGAFLPSLLFRKHLHERPPHCYYLVGTSVDSSSFPDSHEDEDDHSDCTSTT